MDVQVENPPIFERLAEKSKFKFDFAKPPGKEHADAEIYLFEANPGFNKFLVRGKQQYPLVDIHIFPSTLVYTEDSVRSFYVDDKDIKNDFWVWEWARF